MGGVFLPPSVKQDALRRDDAPVPGSTPTPLTTLALSPLNPTAAEDSPERRVMQKSKPSCNVKGPSSTRGSKGGSTPPANGDGALDASGRSSSPHSGIVSRIRDKSQPVGS